MKNRIFLLMAGMVFAAACNENVSLVSDTSQIEFQYSQSAQEEGDSIRAILQDRCMSDIRSYFNDSLSPSQIYYVWMSKLNQVLTTNISDSMEYYINMAKNELSPDVYVDSSSQNIYFTSTFLPSWGAFVTNHFSNVSGTLIFYTIYDYDPADDLGIQNVGENPDCNCNQSSTFGACQLFGNDCEDLVCGYGSWGCGAFMAFRCNGVCNDVPKPSGHTTECY